MASAIDSMKPRHGGAVAAADLHANLEATRAEDAFQPTDADGRLRLDGAS